MLGLTILISSILFGNTMRLSAQELSQNLLSGTSSHAAVNITEAK